MVPYNLSLGNPLLLRLRSGVWTVETLRRPPQSSTYREPCDSALSDVIMKGARLRFARLEETPLRGSGR